MNRWSFAVSIPVVLLGLVIVGITAWLCYSNWDRGGRRRAVALLEGLRFVLVLLLGFTLLRPEFVREIQKTETPEVIILADASGSMLTRDLVLSNSVITRADWVRGATQPDRWKVLEQNAEVSVERFAIADTNATAATGGQGTDLNSALESVLQRGRNLKAVLVLSDGDWNVGKSPVGTATRFRSENIPVFTVTVGRESPAPDLALEDVSAPAYGLFGEQILIPFRIQNHLPREVKTVVTLLDGTREESRKEVTIPALDSIQEAVVWYPKTVGDRDLTLRVPVEPEESLPDNNEKQFRVGVRLETLKVLVVDSFPRWEYRYLRNALERDPGVEMRAVLYHPGISMGGGRNYLSAFPGRKEDLSRYDVVFLGDVGIGDGELTESDAELLRGLVEQQSSGLVFLPGRRGRQLTFTGSPLEELMPVVLDPSKPAGIGLQNESTLLLSTVGKTHLLTRFESDADRNDLIWKYLPGFFWSAAVEKSRPGSEVLAVHSSLRTSWGRIPLLVTRPHGSGKVLFMGTDSAWRWRRGVEDKYHYRFWSQVVRWMAHQRHLSEKQGIRLTYSPESPQVGDSVFLQATVLDAAGFPISEGPVVGRITSPSGRTEHVELPGVEGGWGVFKSSFVPLEGGAHTIEIRSERHARELTTEILVTQPQVEKLGQPVNSQILREIAAITGGANGSVESVDALVEQISLLPEAKPVERRTLLWSDPWWGGAILLLLAVYWIGRKLAGMI